MTSGDTVTSQVVLCVSLRCMLVRFAVSRRSVIARSAPHTGYESEGEVHGIRKWGTA